LSLTGLVFATRPVAAAAHTGPTVGVWLTTTDGQNQLTPQANLTFTPGGGTASSTITVDDSQQFQQMLGFGAAMTDTAAYLLGTRMNASQRSALMQQFFSSTNGIGISFVRIPMGSSDFTATPPTNPQSYSYDDLPAGQTDPNLTHFSISHDTAYILPMLQQALQTNPAITFMANPWSPPGWMKTTGTMIGGGNLLPADYEPLAQYFVKFIQAYQAAGIPIYAITPQNEPDVDANGYSGMIFPPSDEANFIANYLGPALAQANLPTKIWAWDSNTLLNDVETILNDSAASQYISGVAWHCYGGNLQMLTTIHNAYPGKDQFETECSTGPTGIAPYSAIDVALDSVQNWARTVVLWNLDLDTNDGPMMGVGCGSCTGLASIDESTGNYTLTQNYYGLGQVSKFVPPGAYHIASNTGDSNLNNAAFSDPNGSKVLVVHNTSTTSDTFNVTWDSTQSFTYTLPAGAIATFQWSGSSLPLSSGYAINAGGSATGAFTSDGYYSGGTTYSTTAGIDTSSVSNPAPQGVYQTERFGNFTYTLPNLLSGAQYTVRLDFAEIFWNSSGQRLFNVTINGQQVLTNFDIFATAGGANKAVDEQFTTTADDHGQITLQFSTVRDNAKVDGIEISFDRLGINAGGGSSGSYVADQFASGGSLYSTSASIDTSGIVSNPAPQSVYQTERFGNFTYTIPHLPANQPYTVRLHFSENFWTSSGQRLFNVLINGQQVLTNYDIFASAGGANKAVAEQFPTTSTASGQIILQFVTVVDNAKVDGIEILGGPTGPILAPGGKCVDVQGANSTDGTPVQLYDCNGTNAQTWTITADGSIQALGKCLDIVGQGTTPGTKVQLWTCWAGANQKWVPQANGSLLNPVSGLCLDDPAGNTADGTQLQMWTCNNLWTQVYHTP
jgi:glucosylceramidase